ncbi:MAG: DUF3298 domain-containing protein [Aquificae bacterium]|nr:DUF3298 domain-containing protein [Aquificota bacterium]
MREKLLFYFFIFFIFSISFANEKVKIKEVNINIQREIIPLVEIEKEKEKEENSLKEKKVLQKIESKIPLLNFPFNNDLTEKVKKQIYDYLIPVVGDEALIEFKSNYEIGINDGRIFSIKLYSYEYYFGAAHGNSDIFAINIDLKCKRFIKFFDIFAEKKHIYDEKTKTYKEIFPLEEIKKILKEKIKNHLKCDIFEEEFNKCSYIPQIFLKKEGIEFIFPKYEITAGACGSFGLEIPYKELKIYMRDDIDFLKF